MVNGADRRVAGLAAFVALLMLAAAFASVPLYRLFCQATGYGGTTQRADKAPGAVSDQQITVRFNATVSSALPWAFQPTQNTIDVKFGEPTIATFEARNLSSQPTKGTATFNVVPEIVGQYFSKIECFCFTEQALKPGESARLPVTFFVDPAMLKDRDASAIGEITLSYTFFPVTERVSPFVARAGGGNALR